MKHYGDITKIKGSDVPIVDVITGGSPCQDLSVAGKRAGLDGERSGLFMEQVRVFKEMRDECIRQLRMRGADVNVRSIRPRFFVWENVPGAFSSNKGEDFRAVLEEVCRIADKDATVPLPKEGKWSSSGCIMGDGYSVAWRVHDAQFWGVPQRRKRISLVADFGGSSAPEILFERKGVSGDIEESRKEGQGTTTDIEGSVDKAISFQERAGKPGGGKGILIQNERTGALSTLNNQSVCYGISSYDSNAMKSSNPHSGIYEADTSRTLDLNGGNPGCNQGGMMVIQGCVVLNDQGGSQMSVSENVSGCLRAQEHGHQPCVVIENHPADSRVKISEDGIVQTLSSRMGTGGGNVPMVMNASCIDGYNLAENYNVSPTLMCQRVDTKNVPMVIEQPIYTIGHDERSAQFTTDEKTDPLTASDYKDPIKIADCRNTYQEKVGTLSVGAHGGSYNGQDAYNDMFVANQSIVRRLTPLECERLQGFPDGWTDIGDWVDSKGKTHKGESDSPRYKALGNSIAVGYANNKTGFWCWMAERIVKQLKADGVEHPTMASLFDGIGGFPLAFSAYGCDPVWASEIEEFPIAVTKIRFPEEDK